MTRTARLWTVLVLNLALIGALVVVGTAAHSFGVLAEGADYLADAAGIGVALFALWLADRPSTPERPLGYPHATAIAALINGGWLLALSILVTFGALYRLVSGTPEVHGLPVLVVSTVATVVMLAGALILGADDDDGEVEGDDLTMRAILLDTVADAAAAAGVATTGAVILITQGLYWLDSTVALAIALIVGYHALGLVRRVTRVLQGPRDE